MQTAPWNSRFHRAIGRLSMPKSIAKMLTIFGGWRQRSFHSGMVHHRLCAGSLTAARSLLLYMAVSFSHTHTHSCSRTHAHALYTKYILYHPRRHTMSNFKMRLSNMCLRGGCVKIFDLWAADVGQRADGPKVFQSRSHMRIRVHSHVQTNTHKHTHTNTNTHTLKFTCAHKHTNTCTCIHSYSYIPVLVYGVTRLVLT